MKRPHALIIALACALFACTSGPSQPLDSGSGDAWPAPLAADAGHRVGSYTPTPVAVSQIASGTNGQCLITTGGATAWGSCGSSSTPTGTGIPHIVSGVQNAAASLIVNADVDPAAAVAGTKISPNFGSQAISTTGTLAIGTTPATAGDERFYSGDKAEYRDTGNATNYVAFMMGDGSTTNELAIGCDTGLSVGVPNMQVRVAASDLIQMGSISYTNVTLDTANQCLSVGIAGSAPTGAAAISQLYGIGAGHLAVTDTAGNRGESQIVTQALTSNFTTTLATSTNTNHTISAAANEIWLVQWDFAIGCNNTGGYKVQVSTPSGATVRGYVTGAGNGANTYASASIASINTLFGAPFGTGATIDPMRGWALVTMGSTAGNIQIGVASGTATQTTTVYAGSSIRASIAVLK